LRIFPGEKSITPVNIRKSRIFGPSAGFYNQEVYLEFQTQSEKFENIQIDFPDGSIMNGTGRGQQIKPFRFAVTNQVINHTISPEVGQCMYLSK
jgi:hypothetical protein